MKIANRKAGKRQGLPLNEALTNILDRPNDSRPINYARSIFTDGVGLSDAVGGFL